MISIARVCITDNVKYITRKWIIIVAGKASKLRSGSLIVSLEISGKCLLFIVNGIKSVAFLTIGWYYTIEDLKIPKKDIKMIEKWIEENKEDLHEIYHFVHENEMEGSKIIYGEQLKGPNKNIIIKSYELYILYDVIFIVQSEEMQDSQKQEIVRNSTRLGVLYLE